MNAIEIISSIEKAPVGFEPAGAFFFSQTEFVKNSCGIPSYSKKTKDTGSPFSWFPGKEDSNVSSYQQQILTHYGDTYSTPVLPFHRRNADESSGGARGWGDRELQWNERDRYVGNLFRRDHGDQAHERG